MVRHIRFIRVLLIFNFLHYPNIFQRFWLCSKTGLLSLTFAENPRKPFISRKIFFAVSGKSQKMNGFRAFSAIFE